MDTTRLKPLIETFWEDSILPSITEYIRIPNKSPAFDPQWAEHGYMEDAVKLMAGWAHQQLAGFPGATLEVVRLPGRTPLIFIEVPGDSDDTVLLYGHLDKQPEMKGWATSCMAAAVPTTAMRSMPVSPRCGRSASRRCRAAAAS